MRADAPDENTLPMPHLNRPTITPTEGPPVKLGAKWQANSRVTGYPNVTPHTLDPVGEDNQSRNTPPDTRFSAGVDLRF